MKKLKNDEAWNKIFEQKNILESIKSNGYFQITSNEINSFRESRLMTKFDHKSQLPEVFSKNNLSILPTSRGTYEIGYFDTFLNLDENDSKKIETITFPDIYESIDINQINSGANAINCAYVSKILHNFTEEESLVPTVSGRMSSSSFDFNITTINKKVKNIKVENSQIEIDGGYEGDRSLNIIEAKNYISDDFIIRQLYYPFRLWSKKVSKKVRPIFLSYSNGIYHLREYQFENIDNYNSIKLIKSNKYQFYNLSINLETINTILDKVNIVNEPTIPFPQANSFERIINICELLLYSKFLSKEEITQNYDFDSRQTDYYINAAIYLDLVEYGTGFYKKSIKLTDLALKIYSYPINRRQIEFIKLILSHKVFHDTLKLYLKNHSNPSNQIIVEIMKQSNLYKIDSDSTYYRRSSTVISWLNWIFDLIED